MNDDTVRTSMRPRPRSDRGDSSDRSGSCSQTDSNCVLQKKDEMTSNQWGDNRILGTLRSAGGKGIVRMEDRFDTDIDDLWSALTEPHRLTHWLGEVEGICARAASSALALPASGKARGASKRASRPGGCGW